MKTYLVGGAVRDHLLGLEPKDRDWVIVGATSEDVERMIAQGYTQVGADFPVFLHPTTGEEYALARIERKTGTGYLGFSVETTNVTIEDDLARRDLTINSMAMDDDGTIIDPYHGQRDLRNGILRHTSSAFVEDPLRVLRLARFAARYEHFNIASETVELCQQVGKSNELNHLAVERIWTELEKGFSEDHPEKFMDALNGTHALEHCDVLKQTFGSSLCPYQFESCKHVAKVISRDLRMLIGVAVISKKNSQLVGAPSRLQTLYENIHRAFSTKYCSSDLAALLKKSGAYREGETFNDLCKAILVMNMSRDKRLAFSYAEMLSAANAAREIKASQFPALSGKALGEAIDLARAAILEKTLSIPKCSCTDH